MRNKLSIIFNLFVIFLMPYMIYIIIGDSKVNFSMADIVLVLVGVIFLINIKEFFIQRRWIYLLYFTGLLFSLFLSQYISKFNDDFLHVENSVMFLEMVKTLVVAMYFFTAFMLIKNEKDYKVTLTAISLSSIPVIIIGILSYTCFLWGKVFFLEPYRIENLRFYGTFEDPNLCAFYFIFIFFISLLNYRCQENKMLRYLMVVISTLSFVVIALTMSRGAWLALFGALVLFLVLNRRSIKKEAIIPVISIFIILALFINMDYYIQKGAITITMINRVQDSISMDAGDLNRVQLMKTAIKMGNDNFLFGVGKGSFPLNTYRYLPEDSIQYEMRYIPHNTILGFYAQQGIVGVLIFIILPVYILYRMIRNERKQNSYLIPLFFGLFIQSITINIENVRFLWYFMGLMLVAEKLDIHLELAPAVSLSKRKYATTLLVLLLIAAILYIDVSRKLALNIYAYKGNLYEKSIVVSGTGEYQLTFDIYTDDHLHYVELYDGNDLIKEMRFKSAQGVVKAPIHIEKECLVVFKSHEKGVMKVKNAYIEGNNEKIPLYNYILLPKFIEDWYYRMGYLMYSDEPSYKKQFLIEDDKLKAFEILSGKVIRYSNLSHVFQINMKSLKKVDINYQMELLMEYNSISNLFPGEYQSNLWLHRFYPLPLTSKWEVGQDYIVESNMLFASEGYGLYGRYFDYRNKVYSQESYFPIKYDMIKEKQNIIELGDSKWINIRYNKDRENLIHMASNGWVETGRMNLLKGNHEITFKAQGSFLEEYSKLRLRDSYLNEIAEITLDGTMREYTVKYHTDEDQQGISFVLELINYKSEEGIGNRKVLLEDWLRVK